jgi:N-acetylneuraminic acid mutarotase
MKTLIHASSKLFLLSLGTLLLAMGQMAIGQDAWQALSSVGAPSARVFYHANTAIWTGNEMLIWGGWDAANFFNDGARYNPVSDTWTALPTTDAPAARENFTTIWTGTAMIVWGGDVGPGVNLNTGARYNPSLDTWTAISTVGAPSPRQTHTAVWTGTEMIVWGGNNTFNSVVFGDGARYNPVSDSWTPVSGTGAPSPRGQGAAVWTGTEMIVWGGLDNLNTFLNDGARYNPLTDTWAPVQSSGAPSARGDSISAVWTGSEMIISGGQPISASMARYNPTSDTWTTVSTVGAPSARVYNSAIWTGSEMIIWGGQNGSTLNDGARYNPVSDSWTPTTLTGAPGPRNVHAAVWTGNQMIIWGGSSSTFLGATNGILNDIYSYTIVGIPPTARAGLDQNIRAGDTVYLDGSASFDDNTASTALLYSWSLVSRPAGSTATLTGAATATPHFVADVTGTYDVQLIVTDSDGLPSSPDHVLCSSANLAPTAVATVDFNLLILGETAHLNGSASTDPELDPLSYSWSITAKPSGSTATLVNASSATPTLTPDMVGVYQVKLVVSDFLGPGTPATVEVTSTTATEFAKQKIVQASSLISGLSSGQVTSRGNQNALLKFLSQAVDALDKGKDATDALQKSIERTDGCFFRSFPDGNGAGMDWIIDCTIQIQVYSLLNAALQAL